MLAPATCVTSATTSSTALKSCRCAPDCCYTHIPQKHLKPTAATHLHASTTPQHSRQPTSLKSVVHLLFVFKFWPKSTRERAKVAHARKGLKHMCIYTPLVGSARHTAGCQACVQGIQNSDSVCVYPRQFVCGTQTSAVCSAAENNDKQIPTNPYFNTTEAKSQCICTNPSQVVFQVFISVGRCAAAQPAVHRSTNPILITAAQPSHPRSSVLLITTWLRPAAL